MALAEEKKTDVNYSFTLLINIIHSHKTQPDLGPYPAPTRNYFDKKFRT